jgi:hypothetical protein
MNRSRCSRTTPAGPGRGELARVGGGTSRRRAGKTAGLLLGLLFLAALLLAGHAVHRSSGVAQAQVSDHYDLSWHVIASGGTRMESAGGHTLWGTTGQAVTGTMYSSGHFLCSGFWCADAAARYRIYLPLLLRSF